MLTLKTILISFFSSSAVVAAVIFITRHWFVEKIKATLKKDASLIIEEHKAKLKAESAREIERLKSQLKSSELLLPKRLEALRSLYELNYQISPKRFARDMDWYDACQMISEDFEEYETKIESIIMTYGNVLDKQTLKELRQCASICSDGKFELDIPAAELAEKLLRSMSILLERYDTAVKGDTV